jgi:hypothetical protein
MDSNARRSISICNKKNTDLSISGLIKNIPDFISDHIGAMKMMVISVHPA